MPFPGNLAEYSRAEPGQAQSQGAVLDYEEMVEFIEAASEEELKNLVESGDLAESEVKKVTESKKRAVLVKE